MKDNKVLIPLICVYRYLNRRIIHFSNNDFLSVPRPEMIELNLLVALKNATMTFSNTKCYNIGAKCKNAKCVLHLNKKSKSYKPRGY